MGKLPVFEQQVRLERRFVQVERLTKIGLLGQVDLADAKIQGQQVEVSLLIYGQLPKIGQAAAA